MNDERKMVEIPIGQARLLAKAMGVIEYVPICRELLDTLERAIGAAEVRAIRQDLQRRRPAAGEKAGPIAVAIIEALGDLAGEGHARLDDVAWGRITNLACRRSSARPRWDYVARAITTIESMFRDDPAALARADAVQAYVRDTYDALGISVFDEAALYVAITTAGLLVEMAENGRKRGIVDRDTVRAIATISQTFTAALIDYLPAEARR